MLPTNEKTTDRGAVTDWDSFISELNQPKEEIKSSPQFQQPADENMAGDEYSGGGLPGSDYSGGEQIEDEFKEPINSDMAAMSGKMIAGTIDTTLGTGFSLYAKSTETDKYQAKEKQIEQLNNAWTAVAQKYDYKIEDSPWFNVILLTIAVYLPIWQEAKKDRRFAEMDEKIEEMRKEVEALKEEKEKTQSQAA